MAESSLWTCFLEASIEDILPVAYVDACTTKLNFCKFFLAIPIFASRETSEKILTERLFLHEMVVLQETYLALGCWLACCFCFILPASYHRAADVAKANDQTGLASGSLLTQAHQEIALGVYGTAVPTSPQVVLRGPWGAFPAVDDWRAAMMLTWPWWSLEGSLLRACVELATLQKKKFSFF